MQTLLAVTENTPAPTKTGDSARNKAAKPAAAVTEATYSANVQMDVIEPDPNNRDKLNSERIASLASSIEAEGLLQPIVLRELSGGKYRIIAGEHRWRAFKHLKRETIPARIFKGEQDLGATRKRAIENFQRTDLTPIEEAKMYRQLADQDMTQKAIGELLGKSQPVVANALRLLELPPAVQAMISKRELTMAHGVSLCRFARWPRIVETIAEWAIKEDISSKDMDAEDLPICWKLVNKNLVIEIPVNRSWGRSYKIPAEFSKDPDFMAAGNSVYCFAPAKWAPQKKLQDVEWEKKEKAGEARSARSGGKEMSPTEKAARAKKITDNKKNRAAIVSEQAKALKHLKESKGLSAPGLHVVVEAALENYGGCVDDAAKALGLKLPKASRAGFEYRRLHYKHLASLGQDKLVALTAAAMLLSQSNAAHRFAGKVPPAVALVAAGKAVRP